MSVKAHILIIDDEDAIRDDIKDLLNGLSGVGSNSGKSSGGVKPAVSTVTLRESGDGYA